MFPEESAGIDTKGVTLGRLRIMRQNLQKTAHVGTKNAGKNSAFDVTKFVNSFWSLMKCNQNKLWKDLKVFSV